MPENENDLINLEEVKESEPEEEAETQVEEAGAKDGENPPKTQDRKTNAEFAERRRQAEAKAKEKADKENHNAYVKGKIEGIGGTNTFTGDQIEDEADLREYEIMRKADADGQDPFKALAKATREARQAEAKRIAEAKKAEESSKELALKNIGEFNANHPDANFKELYVGNAKFKELCDVGMHPNKAYDFLGLKPKPASKPTPTPSSGQQGTAKAKGVKGMSDEEFAKYWDNL